MKILHVCETITGGVATYLNTFEALCGDKVESTFVVPQEQVSEMASGCRIVTYHRRKRGGGAVVRLAKAARGAAQEISPDAIIFHSTFSLGAMAILRGLRVSGAFVYCPHGWARLRYTESPSKARLVSAVEGRLAGLSDLVLNISKNDKALAQQHGYRGRQIVVENALPDLAASVGPSPFGEAAERINLLFVGRFERQKGLDILLHALPRAVSVNPALHLHVVGANVQGDSGIAAVSDQHVTFHDWVPRDRISAYYSHADLVVMPSRWEGLPMVLIEALRAATPVMLGRTSGLDELVEEGRSGIVVAPTVDGFAGALREVTKTGVKAMRPDARSLYETRYGAERFQRETLEALETAQTAH